MSGRKLQPCGTWAAYKRHLKAGESPCEPCKQATRERARVYYERQGRARYRARRAGGKQSSPEANPLLAAARMETDEKLPATLAVAVQHRDAKAATGDVSMAAWYAELVAACSQVIAERRELAVAVETGFAEQYVTVGEVTCEPDDD